MEIHHRKNIRLNGYDYNTPGWYFITICTKNKQKLLGAVVGTGLPDGPKLRYTKYGEAALKQLNFMSDFYRDIRVDKFVIMPNHIHFLIRLMDTEDGPSGRPVPTNSKISKFIGTFKRFCNRSCGCNLWQPRSYDHIIRNEQDYQRIWQYIDNNPAKWREDRFYID